jgi:hypothetical protein
VAVDNSAGYISAGISIAGAQSCASMGDPEGAIVSADCSVQQTYLCMSKCTNRCVDATLRYVVWRRHRPLNVGKILFRTCIFAHVRFSTAIYLDIG